MAEWIPSVISEKGIYGGRKVPQGSLDDFSDVAGVAGDLLVCDAEITSYWYAPVQYSWSGAFGLGLVALRDRIHLNQPVETGVKCFEIEIKKPENAQYYKQTLAFYVSLSGSSDTYNAGTTDEYTVYRYNWAFESVKRIVYATPYDTNPTVETIATGTGAMYYQEIEGKTPIDGRTYNQFGPAYIGLSYMRKNNEDYFCIYAYVESKALAWNTQETPIVVDENYNSWFGAFGISKALLDDYFAEFEPDETDDPNEDPDPDPEDEGGGGDGDQDKRQDNIPVPDLPPLSGVAAGFVTMYKLYETSMQTFAHDLFDPDIWGAVKQLFADPMDFICGILILPFSPHTARSARPILQRTPLIAWTYYYPVVENQYFEVDCGTIEVPMFYKSCFDANPYTKDHLFLPYIGVVELNPDEVQGRTLSIKYHVDCMTGDCVAFISRTAVSTGMTPVTQVIAQFSGNCGTRVAFGRQSFDNAISASIQLMTGAAGALGAVAMLAGGAGGLASGGKQLAEGMIASGVSGMTMSAVNGAKAHTERAGVMGASAGYMGIQFPYLIREIPHQSLPAEGSYRRLNGYPCNQEGPLSRFSGYTCVESIELSGIGATEGEKEEILNMLTGGVIV